MPGWRICVNIANLGRKPYIPLHTFIVQDLIDLGFLMRGGKSSGTKVELPAHRLHGGTFMSAKNPVLRDSHEYILIFSKESFTRGIKEK